MQDPQQLFPGRHAASPYPAQVRLLVPLPRSGQALSRIWGLRRDRVFCSNGDMDAIRARYKHTNIIARDWRALARFYEDVFGCVPVPPERDVSGAWVEKGTGVPRARLRGAHLRLPGYGDSGPTLEIYQYSENAPRPETAANREGIAHIAFEVDDVEEAASRVFDCGGRRVGEVTQASIPGVGTLTFVYVTDPEGNIIELQSCRPL